jgi:hypothetical protein
MPFTVGFRVFAANAVMSLRLLYHEGAHHDCTFRPPAETPLRNGTRPG